MTNFDKLFESFGSIKVGVIGDVMLDTYWWGRVERISPEAPVPVVSLHHKEYRIGGAANVALNCKALGANVTVLSVTGDDDDAALLENLLNEQQINTSYLVKSKARITTNKTRVIGRNQQMMRLDSEITSDLSEEDEKRFLEQVRHYIERENPSVLIFEDYNKGVLTENCIAAVIALCKEHNTITTVDPKRKNFFAYKGVDIFKPNLKEVKEGLNLTVDEAGVYILTEVHQALEAKLQHSVSFITLSEKGVFYNTDTAGIIIPSHLRNIADVSGAGDTVIAVASLLYAATKDVPLMAEIANIAGGLVCEEVGTVAIDKEKLLQECKLLLS